MTSTAARPMTIPFDVHEVLGVPDRTALSVIHLDLNGPSLSLRQDKASQVVHMRAATGGPDAEICDMVHGVRAVRAFVRSDRPGEIWFYTGEGLSRMVADIAAKLEPPAVLIVTVPAASPSVSAMIHAAAPHLAAAVIRVEPGQDETLTGLVASCEASGPVLTATRRTSPVPEAILSFRALEGRRTPPGPVWASADEAQITGCVLEGDEITGSVILGTDRPYLPLVVARGHGAPVAVGPLTLDSAPGRYRFRLQLPRAVYFDSDLAEVQLGLTGDPALTSTVSCALPPARVLSAEVLLAGETSPATARARRPFAVLVLGESHVPDLGSIARQVKAASPAPVEVWLDGDGGDANRQAQLNALEAELRHHGLDQITRRRGRLGERLAIEAFEKLCEAYDRFAVVECGAAATALPKLDPTAAEPTRFTEDGILLTASADMKAYVQELAYLYSLPEPAYAAWFRQMAANGDGSGQPAFSGFFRWREALRLLLAVEIEGRQG